MRKNILIISTLIFAGFILVGAGYGKTHPKLKRPLPVEWAWQVGFLV